MQALSDYVIIRPAEAPRKSSGGVVLPECLTPAGVNHGYVRSVGKDVEGLGIGDHVFFAPHQGMEVQYCDETFLVLPAAAVFFVA